MSDTPEEVPGDDVPDSAEGDEDRRPWLDDPAHTEIEDLPEEAE